MILDASPKSTLDVTSLNETQVSDVRTTLERSHMHVSALPLTLNHIDPDTKDRADLHAILLTGIPAGVVPGFQNFTGPRPADMLRLNVAIPPTVNNPNPVGLVAGDAAGFPNGRRVFDDIVAIELKAVASATIPLVDPSFTPDAAAALLRDGTAPAPGRYQATFPYVGPPHDGYDAS